jgi:hypothetical protein
LLFPPKVLIVLKHREAALLEYTCEWCRRTKKDGERWILGLAAEKVGAMAARREITILAEWSERWASHNLAVHFCCGKHKESFVLAMFEGARVPRSESKRRLAPAVRTGHAAVATVCDANQRLASTGRSTQQQAAAKKKRPSRRNAEPIFTAPDDDVRAHGLSVQLGHAPICPPAIDDVYGGA